MASLPGSGRVVHEVRQPGFRLQFGLSMTVTSNRSLPPFTHSFSQVFMEHLQQHFGVAKPIKCQEQHCSLDWGKYWRDQVRSTRAAHTSQVSGLLPPYLGTGPP